MKIETLLIARNGVNQLIAHVNTRTPTARAYFLTSRENEISSFTEKCFYRARNDDILNTLGELRQIARDYRLDMFRVPGPRS